MTYTRVIYNNDYGFVIRYKVDNIGLIENNKIIIYYTFESDLIVRLTSLLKKYGLGIVLHEKHLISEILEYSGFKGMNMFLYNKTNGIAQNIKKFMGINNKNKYEKRVLRFGTKPTKYIPKKLS